MNLIKYIVFTGIGKIYNFKSGVSKPIIDYNDIFTGWYGDVNSNIFHYTISDNKYIYIAPSFSDLILKLDPNGRILKKIQFNSSKLIPPRPLSDKRNSNISDLKQHEYGAVNGFYYEIFFDKFQKLFYRRGYYPNKDFVEINDCFKYPFLLVYDDEFKKIGEIDIPDKHSDFIAFVSDEGLCILNQEEYDDNEDVLPFDCYSFEY